VRERGGGEFRCDCTGADGISDLRPELWEFGCISEYCRVFDVK
jgi:hypothetical protein